MTSVPAFDLDLLLREDAWLRAFLRRLVDRDDVDDVAQQTWLAALQRPVALREPRAWLSALAANLARMLHRRGARQLRRERRAARSASLPATAEVVARLEVQRCVAEAVCALPEPTRSAMVLHYHDGLEAPAIAERLGGTPAAVRKRLQRGRERVRAELHRQFGKEWRGSPAVLAFADAADRTMPPVAAGVAPTLLPLAAVGVVAAGLLAMVWIMLPDSAQASPVANATNLAAAAPAPPPDIRDADAAVRIPVDPPQEPAPDAKAPPGSPIVLRGRCLAAEDKTPLAGVEASAYAVLPVDHPDRERRRKENLHTTTDNDGRFEFSIARPAEQIRLELSAAPRMERQGDFDVTAKPIDLGEILIPRAFPVRGLAIDGGRAAAMGVTLDVPLPISLRDDHFTLSVKSDADGHLKLPRLPAGEHKIRVDVRCPWRLLDDTIVVRADPAGTDVVLHVERVPSICGVAFGPDGKPVADLPIEAVPAGAGELGGLIACAKTRADGGFALFYRGDHPDDEVSIRYGSGGPFEFGLAPGTWKWNTSSLRLEVAPAQQLTLTVVERESLRPVEAFKVDLRWYREAGRWQTDVGEDQRHMDGVFVVDRILRCRNVIVVIPRDRMLTPSRDLIIDGDGTAPAPLRVEVERMRPFAVSVTDDQGTFVTGAVVDVMDTRGGATDLEHCDDYRTGRGFTGPMPVAMRHSTGTTDGTGKVELLAPPSCVDLRLVIRHSGPRNTDHVEVLRALPETGKVLRVELPSR